MLISFFFVLRLTDPIPTTETSITPRQRPKAAHNTTAGILPIQPAALTPRKRANLPAGAAQPVGMYPISKNVPCTLLLSFIQGFLIISMKQVAKIQSLPLFCTPSIGVSLSSNNLLNTREVCLEIGNWAITTVFPSQNFTVGKL